MRISVFLLPYILVTICAADEQTDSSASAQRMRSGLGPAKTLSSVSYSTVNPTTANVGQETIVFLTVKNVGKNTINNLWMGVDIKDPLGNTIEQTKTPIYGSGLSFRSAQGLSLAVNASRTFSATYSFSTGSLGHHYAGGTYQYVFVAWENGYPGQPGASTITATQNQYVTLLTPNYTLSGVVTNSRTGYGVPGAVVSVSGAGSGSGTTLADGSYSIADLPSGTYTVTASKTGYQSSSASVSVTSNTTRDFQLASWVSITSFSVSPSTISPGGTVTISYSLSNSSGLSQTVGLGASVRLSGSGGEYTVSDAANDRTVTVPAGSSTQTRSFATQSNYTLGSYDVRAGIWSGTPGGSDYYDYRDQVQAFAVGLEGYHATLTDETFPDNTVLAPNRTFIKTWKIKNVGTVAWDSRCGLGYVGGVLSVNRSRISSTRAIPPGESYSFEVPMQSPATDGTYLEEWKLEKADGITIPIDGSQTVKLQIRVVGGAVASLTVATIEPSTTQTRDWGQSVIYTITVKDQDGQVVPDASVEGVDEIAGAPYQAGLTGSDGTIRYQTGTIPQNLANGTIFSVTFRATKQGYVESAIQTRQVTAWHVLPDPPVISITPSSQLTFAAQYGNNLPSAQNLTITNRLLKFGSN